MAPGMAGATIYHEKQRERKRESFHGVTVKEKTIKRTNVQRTQSIEGSTTIHDVLEEDGSRTFSKGKYSARLEAGRKTRNRRNAKKRTSRQRSKPEFFVFRGRRFANARTRACTIFSFLFSLARHVHRWILVPSRTALAAPLSAREHEARHRWNKTERKTRKEERTYPNRNAVKSDAGEKRFVDACTLIDFASCSRFGKELFQFPADRQKMPRDSLISGTTGARSSRLVISATRASINPTGKRA